MINYKQDNVYQQLLSPDPISTMPHPEKGKALVKEQVVQEKEALKKIAEVLLNAKKPVIFTPGRIILWTWQEGAPEKARVLRDLAAAIGAEILPIMDIRPDYPQMRTAVEINPYHGDLVIGHNKYDVAVFMAVDCSYADVVLKIIKDGTDIYTIALCGHFGHVDATITLCDTGIAKVEELIEVINEMKKSNNNPPARRIEEVRQVLSSPERKKGELISILQQIQERFGYLPEEEVAKVAKLCGMTESTVFGVASFYAQFRFTPIGRNRVMVCRGTACHVQGAPEIFTAIERQLGIKEGETSPDLKYTLESVACIGCCGLAPCIKINEDVHGRLTYKKVTEIFATPKKEGEDVK